MRVHLFAGVYSVAGLLARVALQLTEGLTAFLFRLDTVVARMETTHASNNVPLSPICKVTHLRTIGKAYM